MDPMTTYSLQDDADRSVTVMPVGRETLEKAGERQTEEAEWSATEEERVHHHNHRHRHQQQVRRRRRR